MICNKKPQPLLWAYLTTPYDVNYAHIFQYYQTYIIKWVVFIISESLCFRPDIITSIS